MTWPLAEEREYWRHKCKSNLWWFFKYAFGYDSNPLGGAGSRNWCRPETHKDACDWLQSLLLPWLEARQRGQGYSLKIALLVPRDWGKTTLATQAVPLWLHLHDPDSSIFVGSETQPKAWTFLSSIGNVISGDDPYSRYSWLYGTGRSSDRTWRRDTIVSAYRRNLTRKEPSFGTWGVEQGLTGMHPDVGILDDPTSYEKMASHLQWLDQVNDHYTSLIPVFQQDACIIFPGTRYADEDHFGKVFKVEGVKSVSGRTTLPDGTIYQSELPDFDPRPNGQWHVYFLSARDKEKRPTMPHIWSEDRISSFEANDPMRAAAQLFNDPTTSVLSPLNEQQAKRCVKGARKDYDFRRMYMSIHIDTAFKNQERMARGDETVIEVWGHMLDGSGTVVYWGGYGDNRMRAEDVGELLVDNVQQLHAAGCFVRCITDEKEPGGKMGLWETYLHSRFADRKIIMPEFIYLTRHNSPDAKIRRMTEAASFWARGFVVIPYDAPNYDKLIYQMARIGTSKRVDWADAAADVFSKEVYTAMHTASSTKAEFLQDPWADVLKPGHRGDEAAEEIAKLQAEAEEIAKWLDPI